MIKKIIIVLMAFFIGRLNILAITYYGCDYSSISRLKSLVNNVNISYTYHESDSKIYFDVTLSNITDDLYFYDALTDREYHYSDTNNGEITINNYTEYSGNYIFYSNLSDCVGTKIGNKYFNFPRYNNYYNDPVCESVPNFSLCQKWVDNNYNYSEFIRKVEEYKDNLNKKPDSKPQIEYKTTWVDKLVSLYTKYYYLILLFIILVCSLIIFISRKRNSFNL